MKLNELTAQLRNAGLETVVLSQGDSSIVVTPHGARILGVFTHANAENAYFVNPEFKSVEAAKKMLAGEHMLGGDRLWLAPERGLFFKGDTLADGAITPPAIDPGNWIIGQRTDHSIRLVSECDAHYMRIPGSHVRGLLERSIRLAANPLGYAKEMAPALAKVKYAGYEIASSFRLLESPADDLYFGMWFLIQLIVPKGGYLYAPTAGRTVITEYFEPTTPSYLRVADNHVRFKLDSLERHKIGIRKTEVTGRAGFLSNAGGAGTGDDALLIIRNFHCDPSSNYADVPLHTPAGTQDCIQSYNHLSGPDGFGELEFHSPGICRAMAEPVVNDTNQLWTFTGKREDLVPIAVKLLNLPAEVFAT